MDKLRKQHSGKKKERARRFQDRKRVGWKEVVQRVSVFMDGKEAEGFEKISPECKEARFLDSSVK